MIIRILENQLKASNTTIASMAEEMKAMRASFETTISDLRRTISDLEVLLGKRDGPH